MGFELDEYALLESPIHRWDARAKLIGLLSLMFAFAFVQRLAVVPAMLGLTLVVYGLSRLPLSFLLSRLRYPGFFILGVVCILPFVSGTTVLWQWGFLAIRQEGVLLMLLIVGRFLSIVTLGLVLFGTTPFLSLVRAMRSLGLPALLTDMLLLTYRYLFVLLEMLTTMQRSMRLRGFHSHSSHGMFQSWQILGRRLRRLASLVGTLFIRSYEQAERVYMAMRLRGYGCGQRTAYRSRPVTPQEKRWNRLGLGIALGAAVGIVALGQGI